MILDFGEVDTEAIDTDFKGNITNFEERNVNVEFFEELSLLEIIVEARNSRQEFDKGINWPALDRTYVIAEQRLQNKGPENSL